MAKPKFTNSLSDALTVFWTDYAGWGRATRSEYWWPYLFYSVIVGSILTLVGLDVIWFLVTMVPWFCLTARRLHDTGRSNWNACWILLPLVGVIILIVYFCQPGQKKANKWGKPRI